MQTSPRRCELRRSAFCRCIALEGAVDRRAGHAEQLGEVGDGVLTGAGHADEFALLLGESLGRLPRSLPFALATAMPSRVRIRSRSTSNSAKVARMLKNILPMGSVGS